MSVPEQTPYKEYTANGSTTSFALGFICDSKNDLIVLVDGVEPPVATWSLVDGNAVFTTALASGKKIILQRNTAMSRTTNYQGNNNSFRPETINKDIDRVWLKLQELGVADMLLKIYVDRLHGEQKDYIDNKDQLVRNIITDLRNYVNQLHDNQKNYIDQQDNNRNSYFENLISQQGVSLQQLDGYYKHLLQGIANIAANKGWLASLVVDNNGNSLQSVKDRVVAPEDFYKNTDNGDFRPAFQRAVDYLGVRGGGEVKLTSGKEYLFKTNGGVNSVDQVGFVIVQSNITFSGDRTAVIKIDANLGNYKSIFIQAGGPTSDVQNVQFKGFTVDQNIQNNHNVDILVFPSKNTLAAIWIAARASSIYVEGMCFKNAPGINIVGIASPLGNDIRVNRNLVYFLRGPSTAPNYDHSSIYIDAASFQCVENMAFNLSRTANDKFSIGSAYEVHGSLGSCDDNVAVGFSTFINAVGNLNEASTTKGINGLSIQRNKGYKVLNGIKLLAIEGASLRGVTVKDNYAFISYGEFEPTSGAMVGVSLWPASGEPNTLISKVCIQDNIIVYEKGFTSSTAYALSAGIALESYNTVEDVEISGNKIFDAMFSGISIRQQQGLFSRIVVKDNFIKDAGQNTTGVKHGIAWRGTVIDSKCTGNEIIDTGETLKLQYGVYSSDLSAGSSLGVRGNKLRSPNSTTLLRSAAAETTQGVDTYTINSMGGTIQMPIPQGYLLFDVKLSDSTHTILGSSVVAVDPVPHGTEVTIYITNNHTGNSNFSFTPSFALIAPVVAIPSGSRSFFKFMYDAVSSKWYQSSPQITHST